MAMPAMPHPHLVLLRSAATVVLSALIAQAGWAAAYLGGESHYALHYAVGAWITLALTVVSALVYLVLRRSAGPVNVALAVVLALAVAAQFALGHTGQRALHIFVGVLVAMLGTALTSWTYRHVLPDATKV